MTTLTFQTPDEACAWDMYVAGALACPLIHHYAGAVGLADEALIERRKRMAPEKPRYVLELPDYPDGSDPETILEKIKGESK